MTATNLNIRTDKEVKKSAERLFEESGLNMTTAVNMFLRQAIRENRIPFELTLNTSDFVTSSAFYIKALFCISVSKSSPYFLAIKEASLFSSE